MTASILSRTDLYRDVKSELYNKHQGTSDVCGGDQDYWVSSDGSDDTGDGSFNSPYATVARAYRDLPSEIRPLAGDTVHLMIRIKAPYTGPIGQLFWDRCNLYQKPSNGTSISSTHKLVIQGWCDPSLVGTVNDPRWTLLAGPITPTAVATFGTYHVKYTLPASTIASNEQYLGRLVRIYQAGVEVARASIVRTTAGATQELLVSPSVAYTPAVTDELRIVEPSVVLGGVPGGSSRTNSFVRVPGPMFVLRFECIKQTDYVTISGDTLVAYSESTVEATDGSGAFFVDSITASIQLSANSLTGVTQDRSSLVFPSVIYRTAPASYVGRGNLTINSAGCALIGQWQGSSFGPSRLIMNAAGSVLRGQARTASWYYPQTIVITNGTVSKPILVIPASSASPVSIENNSMFVCSGYIAVDAAKSQGDFISISRGLMLPVDGSSAPILVPAEVAVPTLASGVVVNVVRDGNAQVNTTSTLKGAGSVDVKSGSNAGLTWANLAAASGKTSTDTAVLARVWSV